MGNMLPWSTAALYRQNVADDQVRRKMVVKKLLERLNINDPEIQVRRRAILSMPLLQLRDALQQEQLRAGDVVEAYFWKCLAIQAEVNCITDFLIESVNEAKQMDEKWAGRSDKPPLFGVPFSVKSNLYVYGHSCAMGLAKYLEPVDCECSLVTYLRSLGAIPIVMTNVPQALLSFVCSNSVYGTTKNPHDHERTPGGSSGGECALLASGGIPFGIGSDLAGSLRIPASMCGVITLKSGQDRLVVKNCHAGIPGRGRLGLGYGFFTKTVDDQVELLRLVYGSPEYCRLAPKCAPVPLSSQRIKEASRKKLRLGYFTNDGFLPSVPACVRVVEDTVEKMKLLGHEMVRFSVPEPDVAASLSYINLLPDGGSYTLHLFDDEVVSRFMKQFVLLLKIPKWIRFIGSFLLSGISKQFSIIAKSYVTNVSELREVQEDTDNYIENFTNLWNEYEIDGLICPAFPVPAVPHEYPSSLTSCVFATALFNMLDYPAGIVTTGKVTSEDEAKVLSEDDWPTGVNFVLKTMRNACQGSTGLPLSVQVVCLPYHEEECLAIMKQVEEAWSY